MSILDSLQISLFGLSIVFIVLIALSFLVILQSFVLGRLFKAKEVVIPSEIIETLEAEEVSGDASFSTGELKLVNVDERTAAMIMAIVSDESKIPLQELRFKAIRALD